MHCTAYRLIVHRHGAEGAAVRTLHVRQTNRSHPRSRTRACRGCTARSIRLPRLWQTAHRVNDCALPCLSIMPGVSTSVTHLSSSFGSSFSLSRPAPIGRAHSHPHRPIRAAYASDSTCWRTLYIAAHVPERRVRKRLVHNLHAHAVRRRSSTVGVQLVRFSTTEDPACSINGRVELGGSSP